MNKIKYIFITSILIFLINFPVHFMYNFFPTTFISLFFPINESIFQHLKMIFTSFTIFYFFTFLFKNKFKIYNIPILNLLSSTLCISTFLIIYMPLYKAIGENLIITIILLFLSILFSQTITHFLSLQRLPKLFNILSVIITLLILILNIYLTFNPPKKPLFYDSLHKTYYFSSNFLYFNLCKSHTKIKKVSIYSHFFI